MKIRIIITFGMFFCVAFAFAQVGINEQYPKATFDIEAKTDGSDSEGILIPRLTANQVRLMTNKISLGNYIIGEDQNSLLIYITEAFTTKLGGKFEYIDSPGYYYFIYDKNRATDSRWVKLLNTFDRSTGLEKITEGGKTGWRLIGRDPDKYGNIGDKAIDLSYSGLSSKSYGATGELSTAIGGYATASKFASIALGYGATASNIYAVALGNNTTASGEYSTAMGHFTHASDDYSTAMGLYNVTPTNALLMVGNGTSKTDRQNALTIYKDGVIEAKAIASTNGSTATRVVVVDSEGKLKSIDKNSLGGGSYTAGAGIEIDGNTISATGLEKITEGKNIGWRLIGRDPANYGNIGNKAIDLSYNDSTSDVKGATGNFSIAMGVETTASGNTSTAMGYYTTASGEASTAMGNKTTAPYDYSTAIGTYNATPTDALLMVGNGKYGYPNSIYQNALTIYKDGTIEAKAIADTNGGSTDKVVVVDTDGKLKSIQRSAIAGNSENIYTTNGTITGKRTVTLANESSDITLTKLGTNNKNPLLIINGTAKMMAADMNSDARLKQNVTSLSSKNINNLRAVSYFWNADGKKRGGNDKLQYGFIAQEVEKVYPNLVSTDKDGYKSVNYMQVIPILTRAIQEERQINQEQQIQLDKQAKEIAHLKELIEGLIK